jgi:hypothetical protein
MSASSTPIRTGRIMMTVAAAIYGFVPPFADFNATHALNPLWPGHARYHVVWQVIITFWLAMLGLYLLRTKSAEKEFTTRVSFLLGLIVLGGFLCNAAVRHLYGGALIDANGAPPIFFGWDANLTLFSAGFVILVIGYWMTRSKAN